MESKNKKYITTKEKSRQYNQAFYKKHIERMKEQIICDVCKGHYTYYNKSRHFKSQRHQVFKTPSTPTQ